METEFISDEISLDETIHKGIKYDGPVFEIRAHESLIGEIFGFSRYLDLDMIYLNIKNTFDPVDPKKGESKNGELSIELNINGSLVTLTNHDYEDDVKSSIRTPNYIYELQGIDCLCRSLSKHTVFLLYTVKQIPLEDLRQNYNNRCSMDIIPKLNMGTSNKKSSSKKLSTFSKALLLFRHSKKN